MADLDAIHDELVECQSQLAQMEGERDAAVADKDDLLNSYNQARAGTRKQAAAGNRQAQALL